jgi:ribosome biogenesis protein MAK21
MLTPGDREVALQLVDVYFEMFKELLGEGNSSNEVKVLNDVQSDKGDDRRNKERKKEGRKGHVRAKGKAKAKEVKGDAGFAEVEDEHSKLISAILTGVNRALPFARISSADVGLVLFYNDLLYCSLDTFAGSTNISTLYFSLHTHLRLIYPSSPSFLSNNSHILCRPRRI